MSICKHQTDCLFCLLPAGRCWIGLGLNPTWVEFSGSAGGVSDHVYSLTVGYPGGLSEQIQPT